LKYLAMLPILGAVALPQAQPPVAPNIKNLTMWGTGCPIGAAGQVTGTRGETPVFSFVEWGLSLPNTDDPEAPGTASKFCTEEITLSNGPVGLQLRIESVTVSGWASLEEGTKLIVEADTRLGDVEAGKQIATITKADIKDGVFELPLEILPTVYSACVEASGDVPKIVVKTTVSLIGERRADGSFSGGVVGGDKTDLKKALGVHFTPVWRPCARPM
ncbi:hypothetical protein QBC35DRAFT_356339, partial [Podospora australis]